MDAEIKTKWVEALRSGKYVQGQCGLRVNERFCCLGVLCDIIEPDGWGSEILKQTHNDNDNYPSNGIMKRAGLSIDVALEIAEDNDRGTSFLELADYIEAHL